MSCIIETITKLPDTFSLPSYQKRNIPAESWAWLKKQLTKLAILNQNYWWKFQ